MLDYLNQTLGLPATITPWAEAEQFPLYLRNGKQYFLLHIGGMECVLIEVDENNFSLPTFRKQMAKLPAKPEFIVLCFKHPYFETNIQNNADGIGGYIDTMIDKSDLEFTSQFFMSLGEDAKVVEPKEMKEYILSFARRLLEHYK